MKKLSLFIVLLMLLAGNAWAATIHVDASNTSGNEDGSINLPFNTIQEGINAAVGGDTVLVAPGIYYGSIELKHQVKLISEKGPEVTIIDGMGGRYTAVVKPPYSLTAHSYIEGFTVRNGYHLLLAENRVSFWHYSSMEVHNCILKNGTFGIQVYPMANVTITRTVITDVLRAIDAIWCYVPKFKNVTIDNAYSAFFIYQISLNADNTSVSNVENVIELWGSRGSGYVYGSNNNFWNYTNFSVPTWSGRYPVLNLSNSLYEDPLFVAPPDDYHLQSSSPLIDAGIDIGLPYLGTAPDIGAYEHEPTSIPELVESLAVSYQEVPLPAFKNAGEQRRNAMTNKLKSVLQTLGTIRDDMPDKAKIGILTASLNKLKNDVLAKADGFHGGNPNNDWITSKEEQDALYPKVMGIINTIEAEISSLSAK